MSALVVLPTFQEAGNVEVAIRAIRAAAPDVHVLVVDDASPDGTAAIAERVGAEVGQVDILRRDGKHGLGRAYRAGFGWGMDRGFDVLVSMDADLSHDAAALPLLLAASATADVVVGSRYVPGGTIPDWSFHRRALSRWGNRYADAVLRLGVRDATSGFRAYRTEALRHLDLDRLSADGYGFQIEMVYRLVRQGGRAAEVPIHFVDRRVGKSKMSGRIIVEAFALVTGWAAMDVLHRFRR
ncbi:MAG TPA: polyprenol monophosphomannose synthase [Acidimicrobiales bacterium]|nr:polyprenol monophosphomannose synthase [Acidimicrobiales bacterium]